MRLNAFEHEDADIGFDPLSANRRFAGTADLAVLGTLVFAGPTRETISVMAYCSRALRPSQRRYCTTKRDMLAVVAMCIQFRSYLRGARFTLRTDHKSLVWLHRFKDTEGMLSRWLHSLQQFQFSIIHRPGKDHGNADGLSRAPSAPCRQCTRPDSGGPAEQPAIAIALGRHRWSW